jgi:iron complex transport system ATP-binding protein
MTSLFAASGLSIAGRLQPTNLTAAAGERIALIGPNGGGKTSLLRAIAGVEGAKGEVRIDGELLPSTGRRRGRMLGLMRASRDLAWAIAVRDVLRLGAPVSDERLDGLIEEFELSPLLDRPAPELSTGERARVLMARVLAGAPRVLLLDEPLSNLDPYWVLKFLDQIDRQASEGSTVFCALHDLNLLGRFDRAILIADGQIAADRSARAVAESEELAKAFRIDRAPGGGWRIRPPADPRSSP